MVFYEIWTQEDEHVFWKLLETALVLFTHYLGGYALAASFVLYFMFQSVPITFMFGDYALGTPIQVTLNYISAMPQYDGWLVFLQMGWYYKIAVMIGWFFPIHHLIFAYETEPSLNSPKRVPEFEPLKAPLLYTHRYDIDWNDPDIDDVKQYNAEMDRKALEKKMKKRKKIKR